MPVGQFSGVRNWGYDGVLPYAAQHSYGGPRQLQKLVDAAHAIGLAIFLDVVYNHFGPEHSYLDEFGHYFNDCYKTPWGRAVNFDGRHSDAVREYVLDNARMWLREFHFDGLRLDAVHAMYDVGATHILREIGELAQEVARETGRHTHIVAESDLNDPRVVRDANVGGHGIDAQWSDDFHHAAHAYLTGETRGYYQDYGERRHIAKVHRGAVSVCRRIQQEPGAEAWREGGGDFRGPFCRLRAESRPGGEPRRGIGWRRFCKSRRRFGSRLLCSCSHRIFRLLFMGEEYGEKNPFPFFCSFCGKELIEAVREGRNREFADFVDNPDEIPVPDAIATFESARLSWSWPEGTVHGGVRALYRDLLHARQRWPALMDFTTRTSRLLPDEASGPLLELIRGTGNRRLRIFFNLSADTQPMPECDGEMIFSSEMSCYGGNRAVLPDIHNLSPFECVAFQDGA